MHIFLLIVGLAVLWIGSELIVRGSIDVAEHYKISHIFLGLTILALGTDLPETFIAITGAIYNFQGIENSGLIVGEIIGSSVSQITLILGMVGLFGWVHITAKEYKRDGSMLILSVLILFLVGFDGRISIPEGILMVIVYFFYFYSLFYGEKIFSKFKIRPKVNILWSIISIIAGFILLIYAANFTLNQAMIVTEKWGLLQTWVGIVIIGLGTSLPELVTSVAAVRRQAGGMAIGNLLGSTIYDLLVPLGLGTLISRFYVDKNLLNFDLPILFIISIILLVLFRKDRKIKYYEALILIIIYFGYIIYHVLKAF